MRSKAGRHKCLMATSGPLLEPPPGESYWDVTGKTFLFVPLFGLLHTSFLSRLLVSFSPRYSRGSTCGCLSRGQGSSVTWGGFRGGVRTRLAGFHLHLLFSPHSASLFITSVAPGGARWPSLPNVLFGSEGGRKGYFTLNPRPIFP